MGLRAQSRTRVVAWCTGALVLALVATNGSAAAAPRPIGGKLSKSGYTVIALAPNGKARVARASGRRFRLRPPARGVTLHLRAPSGTYAGPIVVGREKRGRRAIVGINAGARLGRVSVRRGYAKVSKRLRKEWVDVSRWARARRGVPIGASVFGRVRSRHPRATVPGDGDLDGVPDPLDIDDDGDLVLDNLDRRPAARVAQKTNELDINFQLGAPLSETANANAPGSSDEQIDAALPNLGILSMRILPGDSVELDCGGAIQDPPRPEGLVYCSSGGTGRVHRAGVSFSDSPPFPDCCDDEPQDGFGTLTPHPAFGPFFFLFPGATSAQIGTGDILAQRINDAGGVEVGAVTATLQYVFATVPALVSYSDAAGNSATVAYPVARPGPGGSPLGTPGNGFPVAGPDDNIALTVTFWRPQRRPIPGEPGHGVPGAWTDIGGLTYTAVVQEVPDPGNPSGRLRVAKGCPQSAFSSSDPELTPASSPVPIQSGPDAGGLTDLAPDRVANTANTFTYTLNVSQCLASLGFSWNPGEAIFSFRAVTDKFAFAEQGVWFKRQ